MARKAALSFEQWVEQFFDNAAYFFNLSGWALTIEFTDDTPDDGKGNIVYAHICILSAYQSATITVSGEARKDYEEKNFDRLTRALVHEIVHIFTEPFAEFTNPHLSDITRPFFLNIVESQTQKLTMVFLKTLPKELLP